MPFPNYINCMYKTRTLATYLWAKILVTIVSVVFFSQQTEKKSGFVNSHCENGNNFLAAKRLRHRYYDWQQFCSTGPIKVQLKHRWGLSQILFEEMTPSTPVCEWYWYFLFLM